MDVVSTSLEEEMDEIGEQNTPTVPPSAGKTAVGVMADTVK